MSTVATQASGRAPGQSEWRSHGAAGRRPRTVWNALTGLVGGVLGLAPHLLHHIGLFAGSVLVAGSGGTALFAVVGLVASVPMLLRLYRRSGTWRAPAVALGVFAVMFAVSTIVIGPAISGQSGTDRPAPTAPAVGHDGHH